MPESSNAPPGDNLRPGAKRAAAVLVGLGAELAGELFKQLTEPEMRLLAQGAKSLRRAPADWVPEALAEFVEAMERVGTEAAAGEEVLRSIAEKAVGPEVVRRTFDGVTPRTLTSEDLLGSLAQADPQALAMVLGREHPQTVALVLSALAPERAADVMGHMGDAQRPQIVRRMASVESVAPELLREVQQALTGELQAMSTEGMRKVDGRSAALEVLRRTPQNQQAEVLGAIERDDPSLAEELKTRLFTFSDLVRLSDRDVQALSKDLDTAQLTVALKGATQEVKDKFLRNMSSRAAQLLEDDLVAMGPVRVSQVEEAQSAIAKQAVEMADAGRITIVRPNDRMV